ncbi:MAG: carboxypeptidase regulatory-like domain-containing protein [Planctomycetota bacterium]|nr:carboxypeptidase regulatory-like domain-containing protein [Planctomycetota bacterium]
MERRRPRLFPPFKLHATVLALLALALLVAAVAPRARAQERRPVDETPQSRVFGRIVDSKGAAVRGAKVELRAIELPWRPDEKRDSFETSSDDTGRFELVVPTPTSEGVVLKVRPDPHLDVATRHFGSALSEKGPRLRTGDNDLHEFVLASTGALSGRVVDSDGRPIADVKLQVSAGPGARWWNAFTNEFGEFVVGHVPEGTYMLEALADGFQVAVLTEKNVTVGSTTAGLHLVLTRAPTISGVVVDEDGVGIAGAKVWGRPKRSGWGSSATTGADGQFVVHLRHDDTHSLGVKAAGFEFVEVLSDQPVAVDPPGPDPSADQASKFLRPERHHRPGTTGLRFVMKRVPVSSTRTRFVVLDDSTSDPISNFSVEWSARVPERVYANGGYGLVRLGLHADGEVECAADPLEHDYVVKSPGYSPASGAVTHDTPESRRCVVRLVKGGVISGQAVLGGKPVDRARVLLRETTLEELFESPVSDETSAYRSWQGPEDPFFLAGLEWTEWTDASGRFSFDSIEPGDYRLEITTDAGARRSLEPIRLPSREAPNLGTIELVPAAVLEGRLVAPVGTSPADIQLKAVVLDVWRSTTTDADGAFRFELPAGSAWVYVHEKPGAIQAASRLEHGLAPGQIRREVIDVSHRAGAWISVAARIDGTPTSSISMSLESTSNRKLHDGLGPIQLDGTRRFWVEALGEADAEFRGPSRMLAASLPKAARLTPSADVRIDVDLAVGRLAFEWPTLPAGETLDMVEITGRREDRVDPVNVVVFWARGPSDADVIRVSAQRCEFRWVQPGEWTWTVRVRSNQRQGGEASRWYRRSATVVAGALAECRLLPEDQIEVPGDRR